MSGSLNELNKESVQTMASEVSSVCPKELYCSFNRRWINKALIYKKDDHEKYDTELVRAGYAIDYVNDKGKRIVLGTLDCKIYDKINMGYYWENATGDLDQVFTGLVDLGYPISVWLKKDHRDSANFVKSNIAGQ